MQTCRRYWAALAWSAGNLRCVVSMYPLDITPESDLKCLAENTSKVCAKNPNYRLWMSIVLEDRVSSKKG